MKRNLASFTLNIFTIWSVSHVSSNSHHHHSFAHADASLTLIKF